MTHDADVQQPFVVSPSPARGGTQNSQKVARGHDRSYGTTTTAVTCDSETRIAIKSSLNTNSPSRPTNQRSNDNNDSNNNLAPYRDSPGRRSNDSSMHYHRMEDSASRIGGRNDNNDDDRIPLRENGPERNDYSGVGNGNDGDVNGGGGGDGFGGDGSPANRNNNLYDETGGLVPSPGHGTDDSDPNSPGDDVPETPLVHHVRTNVLYKRAIFATIPVFMAYASMITLQRSIKDRLGITNDEKEKTDLFGIAVGNLYLGNLIFRLLHNILFSFLIPRHRTMLSYCLLCLNHLIVGLAYWVFDSKSLVWTFIAYLLAGIGIGTFESNLLSCLSPLGHGTKSWAVIGIPVGFNGVSVGFYVLFAIERHVEWIKGFPYFFIAGCNVLGLAFFAFGLPFVEYEASHDNVVKFKEDIVRWREWFPRVRNYCFALCADMFCVSMFSAIVYYIYNLDDIPIWPYAERTIPRDVFQVWYNSCSFLGDFVGRKIAYRDKHRRNPFMFLICSVFGLAMILSKVVILAPFGMCLIMFANGSIYAHTTKHIDNVVDDRFILIALSVWLFVGDVGSYVASLIVQPLQVALGPVPTRDNTPFNNSWGNVTNFPPTSTSPSSHYTTGSSDFYYFNSLN